MQRSRRLNRPVILGAVLGLTMSAGSTPVVLAASHHDAPVIVAVGDLACQSLPKGKGTATCQSQAIADLITQIAPDRFLALGDLQYSNAKLVEFLRVWARQFGHLSGIISPAPGNHEYGTPDAQGYFDYFASVGVEAGAPLGYYSFDLGEWHIVSLNSDICGDDPGCGPGSPQYEWLREDLRNNDAACSLAYMHHPRYDWRPWQKWIVDDGKTLYGGTETEAYVELWELMDRQDVDVVLAAHNHIYQRWAAQDAHANADADGIVQFTVGTGGRSLYPFGRPERPEQLVATQNKAYGALQMTLHPDSYDFAFMSAPGQPGYQDAANGVPCV